MKTRTVEVPLTDPEVALLWGEYHLLRTAEDDVLAIRRRSVIQARDVSPRLEESALKEFADLEQLTIGLILGTAEGLPERLRDFDSLSDPDVRAQLDLDLASDYGALRALSFIRAALLVANAMGDGSGGSIAAALIRLVHLRRFGVQLSYLRVARRFLSADSKCSSFASPDDCAVVEVGNGFVLRLRYR